MQTFLKIASGDTSRRYFNLDYPQITEIRLFARGIKIFTEEDGGYHEFTISEEESRRIQRLLEENHENEPSVTQRPE